MSDKILAWHFLQDDGRLQFGPRKKVIVGETLKVDPEALLMCSWGLHASVKPLDALHYAPGSLVCRVELGGKIIKGDDKIVASERTVLWMADATSTLRLFACWCVRNTPVAGGRKHWDLVTDPCSRKAVAVAERYARGKATKKELAAALDAARIAFGDAAAAAWNAAAAAYIAFGNAAAAAWIAAGGAAWNAAGGAGAEARGAVGGATWIAAGGAAGGAAWAAACDAACDAARDAACDAARDAQNAQLEKMLLKGGDDE